MFINIDDAYNEIKDLPPENFFYYGIKENSVIIVAAPPKVGKTTLTENLCMCIAAGYPIYLNKPVSFGDNQKVLIVSLEERYRARLERNRLQVEYMDSLVGNTDWHKNFFVTGAEFPAYFSNNSHWTLLETEILKVNPVITVIDSLSRLHGGESIEDSSVGIILMKRLKELVEKTKTTLIVIHHTNKIDNVPITQFNMAGTRILGQEADAIIGMNKTYTGKRYIKGLAYRYADDTSDQVQLVTRNQYHWLEDAGKAEEYKLIREFDNRLDDKNTKVVFDYFMKYTKGDTSIVVSTAILMKGMVDSGSMAKPTLHEQLRILTAQGKIIKVDKGKYRLASSAEPDSLTT